MRTLRIVAALAVTTAMLVQTPARAACSWPLIIEADTLNLAYPDTGATYWAARFVGVPGTRLRIDGVYPDARYFSFHAYDEAQRPVDSLADRDLIPDGSGMNPFVTPGADAGDTYTAYVEFTPAPPVRAPNTLYAGASNDAAPNPAVSMLYRVYVPDDPNSLAGGVPLPDITVEVGDEAEVAMQDCKPLPPSTGSPLTQLIRESSFPNEVPRVVPWVPAQNPPQFVKFYALSTNVIDRFPPNPATDPLPRDTSGGFLSNQHINYLFALTSRTNGEVFAMRAKAPSAPDTRAGAEPTDAADLRYWSVCQNNFASQRFVQCLADYEVEVDEDGWFTIVISDPDDRPDNADNWLPWGSVHYDGNVIYRHMLPADGFAGAIQNVAYGQSPQAVMGDHYPVSAYCDRATFESGGFAACSS